MKLIILTLLVSTSIFADISGVYVELNDSPKCPSEIQVTVDPIYYDSAVIDFYFRSGNSKTNYLRAGKVKEGRVIRTKVVSKTEISSTNIKRSFLGLKESLIDKYSISSSSQGEFIRYEQTRVQANTHYTRVCTYKRQ